MRACVFVCVRMRVRVRACVCAGWTCVACIANVAIAFTPKGDTVADLGLGAAPWSVIMQCVAVALGTVLCIRGNWVSAVPISWALNAIRARQRSQSYPGHDAVADCALTLSIVMLLVLLYAAVVTHGLAPRCAAGPAHSSLALSLVTVRR
jgi:hypothetical protein